MTYEAKAVLSALTSLNNL